MVSKDDWRLRGQEDYMRKYKFKYKKFVSQNSGARHAHCEFCWHKFMENPYGVEDCTSHGYCSLDEKYWVCNECFEDFKEMLSWENVEYYIVKFVFESESFYTIWYTSDEDGFVMDSKTNRVIAFKDNNNLLQYAKKKGITVDDECTEYDCVEENYFINEELNCSGILDLWNIAEDMAKSLKVKLEICEDVQSVNKIYDKLFYGCNLPAVTPEGEKYIPVWSEYETNILHDVVRKGILLIKEMSYGI